MTEPRILRAVAYPRMPWKNGAGSTEEITRDAGENLDTFGWRLSIADVQTSGTFSTFAGYQRIITVLEGNGMILDVDGVPSRELTPSDPFAFSGDSQVNYTLVNGSVRDFNLIYAPERYSARLQWIDVHQPQRVFSSATTLLLFSMAEHVAISAGSGGWDILGKHDSVRVDNPGGLLEIELQSPRVSRCCLIELTATTH